MMIKTLLAAEEITNPVLPELYNQTGSTGIDVINQFIPNLIELAFVIAAVIFIFVMIMGGIQWIFSGGDKNAVQSAQGKITNAIIGLVVLFSIFAVIKILGAFFGIAAFQGTFKIDVSNLRIGGS